MRKLLLLLVSGILSVQAQNATISGFVLDGTSSETLIGANVYLDSLTLGASSNNSGYYIITDIPVGKIKLQASYLGYRLFTKNLDIRQGQKLKLNIILFPALMEANAIVVQADSIPLIDKMYNKKISEVRLSKGQLNAIPQIAEADLLRSLQTLPGIVPLSDFSSALYIRGGTPDQNLFLLDGTDVYNPEHAFGLFSTFNTDAIKQVDVSKGGFAANYGGRLSSVIDIINIDGNRQRFKGSFAISLLSAKTTLQMPLGKTGSISGSFRRTYFDQTVGKAVKDIPNYYFYDGNLKAHFELDADNRLNISYYGGRDVLDYTFDTGGGSKSNFKYNWGNTTGSVEWTHVFMPRLFANFWVTSSFFSSYLNFADLNAAEENRLNDITFKGNIEYQSSRNLEIDFGLEHKILNVKYTSLAPGREVYVRRQPRHTAGYLQARWKPLKDLEIQAGLRMNYFNFDTVFAHLSPRLSAKYKLDKRSVLKFASGRYRQYLHRIPRFLVADIWTTSGKDIRASSAEHYIFGYQRELLAGIQFEAETYYKEYHNIYSFDQNFLTRLKPTGYNANDEPVFSIGGELLNRGDGHSRGIELLLRKESGLITGWAGYSLSETIFNVDGINGGSSFAPRHDRRHALNLVANFKMDNLWRSFKNKDASDDSSTWVLGLNFIYTSGQPFTEPGSAYYIGQSPGAPYSDVYFAPTSIDQVRLPYYARLDISLTWMLRYKKWSMAPYLQIYNIGNRGNVWFATYDYTNGQPNLDEQYMFPLLPTIGVNVNF